MTKAGKQGQLDALRATIVTAYRRPETACVSELLHEWQTAPADAEAIRALATRLVAQVREQRRNASGVDHLMQEFSLSSQEGVALMCLAEALLRIPDSDTADRLIRDKISRGDWSAHLGGSSSVFVNAAAWGLMITGKLVATHSTDGLGGALTRLIARSGEPVVRAGVDFAMRLLGQQFVMGETIEAALRRGQADEARGYTFSFDMLGEAAATAQDAERYFAAYHAAIEAVGRASGGRGVRLSPGISIKLSALHPRYVRAQRERALAEMAPRLLDLMRLAKSYDIGVNIDAEEAERLDLSLDLFTLLASDPALSGWHGLGFVVQAYQRRAPAVIDYLIALGRATGHRLPVRLVKGAYWDSEIKRAQVDGLADYPLFTRKVHTDLAYLVCARRLLAAPDAIYPQFATHNAQTLASVLQMARERGINDYEFQCLHGMGEALYDNVVGGSGLSLGLGQLCRVYAPVGSHRTLLPYLVRRLLENGANSSFVNRIVDPAVSIDELTVAPADAIEADGGTPHPLLPRPADILPGRINSAGLDLSDEFELARLELALAELSSRHWTAEPLLAPAAKLSPGGTAQAIFNPANDADSVGAVTIASAAQATAAVDAAVAYADEWRAVPVTTRAAMLESAAAALEAHRDELISLCIREAGKTWGNAVAEIREAVDFCRYYAHEARRLDLSVAPGAGPLVCISPWNFPLAIFLGQISAALAVGRVVLAKPAEQTPLIACFATTLLHAAGIPRAALQLLPGAGEIVGAALVADQRTAGVVFTGSGEVAGLIQRQLAQRSALAGEPLLIAETGGQNVMIVDSTALLEQVVADAISSGFDSAGQRCSALRVLCVQEDIADATVRLLTEAMAELRVGDPGELATDVGPVIDPSACAAIEQHVTRLRAAGARVHQQALAESCRSGTFHAPTVIEIAALNLLEREVFGPVIHVLRYRADELDALLDQINATGFGLTLGIHTRIDETVARVVSRVHVGNIYVNRNMVGAVVGVQPFGGEGRSGTGPKAGGPLYLPRLAGLTEVSAGQLFAAASGLLAKLTAELPGPTGELNRYRLQPRGLVLCTADEAASLAAQEQAVRETGNTLMRAGDASIDWTRIDAVLCVSEESARVWRRQIAERCPELIVPVIAPVAGIYPLYRLLREQVISTNTTAAGGNASLMAMGL